MKKCSFVLLLLMCCILNQAFADLVFDGFLGKDKISALEAQLEKEVPAPKKLTLFINSQSGELGAVIDFARVLYGWRRTHDATISVTISEEAIGPSAILPFLADELFVAPTATWGAVVSSNRPEIPVNVLKSRVIGLIDPQNPHYELLKLIAAAMCDSTMQVVSENGLKQVFEPREGQELITRDGDTLVLNQSQVVALKLATITTVAEAVPQKIEPVVNQSLADPFEQKLEKFIHFPDSSSENPTRRIGYISLKNRDEAISQATWIYLNTALAEFKKNPPSCIILELNSPGGEVFAAERMSDALKEMDTQYGVPVICYIDNWAISAGAMLAYSCRFIVAAKDASMGAAEPVMMGQEGAPQTASEKINSALRSDFANRADYFDRNPFIAEAMVDKDILLVERHGKVIKLDSEEQIRKAGMDPDVIISAKGKLLTLNTKQLLEYGVADFELKPKKLKTLTESEKESGIWPIEKSPLGQIPYLKGAVVEAYQMNWQTKFLAFLSTPAVSSLLFMVLLISVYVEVSSGGFGVAGAAGLICLFLILLSSFALEAMHWLEPIMIVFGIILISLEFFFFPTLGILGFAGALLLIVGLAAIMLPGIGQVSYNAEGLNAAGQYVLSRLTWLSGAFLVALVVIAFLSRFIWPKFRLIQKIVLADRPVGVVEVDESSILTRVPPIGSQAIVVATLRPAGKVQIADDLYDAVSTGSFLLEGTKVRVVRIEGHKVIVEESYI